MRLLRAGILLTTFLFVFSPEIVVAGDIEARGFVQKISDKVLKIVKSEKNSVEDKEKWLTEIFEETVDSRWMGRFVLGRYFKQANPEQQKRYLKLYTDFLIRSYVPRFRSYAGGDFKIIGVSSKGDGQYIVQTEIIGETDESPDIRVDYRVRKNGSGKYSVIDIVGEGISLLTTQRSDFAGLISRKGIPYFLDKLDDKVKNMKKSS